MNEYLIQEIDFSENLHLLNIGVEDILKIVDRLLNNISDKTINTIFFYARSIYPTVAVRYNYTSKMTSLIFIESIFANIPYQSIPGYRKINNLVEPIINFKSYNKKLFDAMDKILPLFIQEFYSKQLYRRR